MRGLHGQLRVGLERPLRFHDGPHGRGGDVRMVLDQPLGGDERREGEAASRGGPVATTHDEQDLGDASLHAEIVRRPLPQ